MVTITIAPASFVITSHCHIHSLSLSLSPFGLSECLSVTFVLPLAIANQLTYRTSRAHRNIIVKYFIRCVHTVNSREAHIALGVELRVLCVCVSIIWSHLAVDFGISLQLFAFRLTLTLHVTASSN